jgi:hypothetical protein
MAAVSCDRQEEVMAFGVKMARNGASVTMLLVGLVCGTSAQAAAANGPNCRKIDGTGERLACYDAAFPPKVKKASVLENDVTRTAYKDPFVAEEARTQAKLKNICRGC